VADLRKESFESALDFEDIVSFVATDNFKGGEMAAESILDAFEANDFSAARLGKHGPAFVEGVDALRKLVYAYYDPDFSIAGFLKQYPEQEENLVHLLIGNVYREDVGGLLRAMDEYRELPKYEPIYVEHASA